jgi:pimeloyl-ACP methyl ester carboxylesterase
MIAGPDDGPAIVLIGSLGTTLNMWEPQIAAFSVDHRVVAVDLPGHGGTPTPARPPTVASYAEEVIALLDALNIDSSRWSAFPSEGQWRRYWRRGIPIESAAR